LGRIKFKLANLSILLKFTYPNDKFMTKSFCRKWKIIKNIKYLVFKDQIKFNYIFDYLSQFLKNMCKILDELFCFSSIFQKKLSTFFIFILLFEINDLIIFWNYVSLRLQTLFCDRIDVHSLFYYYFYIFFCTNSIIKFNYLNQLNFFDNISKVLKLTEHNDDLFII
jgi:hypothetical protein